MARIAPGTGTGKEAGTDNPGVRGLAHAAALLATDVCRDVYAGTRRMREKAKTYLPQFPKELDGDYKIRVGCAVLHNAFRRTVKGLAGMVFRKPPVPTDEVPEGMWPHLENIDLAGRDIAEFARDGFEDKLQTGHGVIFVDWYEPGEARNRLEEKSLEARPFWVWIPKDSILRTPFESVDGMPVLSSFAYHAVETERVGAFGEREVERVRQYDLTPTDDGPRVKFRSWKKLPGDSEWDVDESGKLLGERMRRIPVSVDYADRTGFMTSDPPLEDLAHLNVRHFQVQSERDTAVHMTCSPVPVITGVDPERVDEVVSSSKHGLVLPTGADFKLVTPEGVGLEESRQEVQALEQRMATLGLSMLQRDTRAAETAESKRIDKGESDSRLASLALATQQAVRGAMVLHGEWLGIEEVGEIAFNTDFMIEPMSPQMVETLAKRVAEGNLSQETLWDAMIRGEILDDSFDPDLERERIAAEGGLTLEAMRRAGGADAGGDEGMAT